MKSVEQHSNVRDFFNLKGKVALVTGGAGRVGRQLSLALAQAGASVMVGSRNDEQCKAFATRLQEDGHEAFGFKLDVTDETSVVKSLDTVIKKYNRLDILVNNAGIATNVPVEELEIEEFERVMQVNVTGIFTCSKILSAPMKSSKKGSIINISSIYGVTAADQRIYVDSKRNSSLPYAASKAAVIQMTRYLAVYWADHGIRVNSISPGGVFDNQEPDFLKLYNSRVPLGRMAGPYDLMGAILFLASDASSYITGHNLLVDGGWTIW